MSSTLQRSPNAQLADSEFEFFCQFIYNETGIVINEGKREMLYRRLTRIIRERKLSSFHKYYQLLKEQPDIEKNYFINAITTNLTSFFREKHHFDYLSLEKLPALINTQIAGSKNQQLRIWSAAASTGEEPYSIAITLCEALGHFINEWDVKILATDIDSNVLSIAEKGIYSRNKTEDIKLPFLKRYFQKGTGSNLNQVKISPAIKNMVTFKQLNLLHEWPMQGSFDVIFCRNVIIYFDKPTQQSLFARFYEQLKPGGLLILGHSESLGAFQPYFENVGRTIFKRR